MVTPAASAQGADGGVDIKCQALEGGVLLEWVPPLFLLPIQGYIVERDGDSVARLPDNASRYFDASVAPGSHTYALIAINWDGTAMPLGKCEVLVPPAGLRCKAEENRVHLEWGPILIDVIIVRFEVRRNGTIIATLPRDQLSYDDAVPDVGAWRYEVDAFVNEETSFALGTCSVEVRCFGLGAEVDGLTVTLTWDATSVDPTTLPPDIEPVFTVLRDGEVIATTPVPLHVDTVPAPGIYLYRVFVDFGTEGVPARTVGACEVAVPGSTVPPPRDLRCIVLDVSPDPVPIAGGGDPGGSNLATVDTDGDGVADATLSVGIVALDWVNPVPYDKIVIARNKALIATLPGDQTSYLDPVPAGEAYLYSVVGVRGDARSVPARCQVEVPPGFVPPPQDFTCSVSDVILDPADPANPSPPVGEDGALAPVRVVLLSWWNPIRYESLVILRDGEAVAKVDGGTTMYRDVAPPPDARVYGIYGVVAAGQASRTVECVLPGGAVPPVRDLQCFGSDVTPDPIPAGTAVLQWRNPVIYDSILILRDGTLIAQLPGDVQAHSDPGLAPGVYVYAVVSVKDGQRSPPALCEVVIRGPQERNVLYFSVELPWADPAGADVSPLPPLPGNRITCMAGNVDPVQGWSFGVASDPQFIVPLGADVEGTETQAFNGGAGPDFLVVDVLDDGRGVIMAAVIDEGNQDPMETLPPGDAHPLLHIRYGAGPSGTPGQAYPVRYSRGLGEPPVQVIFVVAGFEVLPDTRPGWISLPGMEFIRGDADENGRLELTDAIDILGWLFLGGERPGCLDAANANGTADVNIADPIYILQYLYSGGPEPPQPYPECGIAPSILGCVRHRFCNPPTPAGG